MNQAAAPNIRKLMKMAESALLKQRAQEAINLLQQVLNVNPQHAEANHQIGLILHGAGQNADATQFFERAIQAHPSHANSYLFLALIAEDENRGLDALKLVLHTAMQVAPNSATVHAAVVSTMLRQQQAHMVVPYLENILPQFPNEQELHQFYCIALKVAGRFEDARREYEKHCKKWRAEASFRMLFEMYAPRLSRSSEEIEELRATISASIDRFLAQKPYVNPNMLSYSPNFVLAYHDRDNKELLQRYTRMMRTISPELNYVAPHFKAAEANSSDTIRVAFVSAHMHNHSVGNCYRSAMIELGQQPDFEVALFQLAPVMDAAIQQIIDGGIPIHQAPKNITGTCEMIAAFKPDIVIHPDIGMHTKGQYIAMARLARYQCSLQGHPETTGIDTIDYVISSRTYEPLNAQDNYCETLLCNEGIDTVFKRPTPPAQWLTREELGLPTDKKLYICPMAIQKFHPDFDLALADILKADPQAVLVLFRDFDQQSASALLQERLLGHCDASRVIFLDWQPLDNLLSIMKAADALLDTFHFGAGTTAQYAFGLGLPIVSMPGKYARGRVVHSYYKVMGIEHPPEAHDPKEYVDLAVKLANDRTYAQGLGAQIAQKNEKLFEKASYGSGLAQLLRDIMAQKLDAYRA